MAIKLDKIDLTILSNMQDNGRITNVELARRAGISAPPCLRRVNNLEEQGIIASYHADLEPNILGFSVTVFCEVKLTSQHSANIEAFEQHLNQWPLVRECYLITGDADFLLKIVAQDFDTYQNFLSNHLAQIPIVANLKTQMVIRTAKKEHGIPLELIEAA